MPSLDEIRWKLSTVHERLRALGVVSLSVFGSAARGTSGSLSDIDFLVTFDGPATFDRNMGLKFLLQELFGARIDLVTHRAIRPEMRHSIERESVRVA